MKVYSDTRHNSESLLPYFEYEVLNELKSVEPRTDENCLFYTRFLFEFDDRDLEEQKRIMDKNRDLLVRAVFSGSKSIHMIVEFREIYSDVCRRWYKRIWKLLEEKYFSGADKKCNNPSRLTRAPDVRRADTGKIQKTLINNPTNYISDNREIMSLIGTSQSSWIKEEAEEEERRKLYSLKSKFLSGYSHDGMCKTYTTVKRYLETTFPKIRGNGNSSTWLFAALCTCLKYKDQQTLNEVMEKARREKWSEHELNRTLESAKRRTRE